jgi:ferredoxin
MIIRIDPDACVGHGRCYAIAPDVFDADDQGHGVLRIAPIDGAGPAEVPPRLEASARTGAANCPEGAILIEE